MDTRDATARLPSLAAELRPMLVLALDGTITAVSLWVAMFLRFEGQISTSYRATLLDFMLLLVCYRVLANLLFRLHRWSYRFSGLSDGARVLMATVFGTGLFSGSMYLIRDPGPPRSVVVMELLLSTLLMAAVRFSPRLAGVYVTNWVRSRKDGALRTVIVGAGSAGELLLRDLQRSHDHKYQIVGFVDDDPSKLKQVVGGVTVVGSIADLARVADEHRLAQVLIAIPRLEGRRIQVILSVCAHLKLRFKILPVSYVYLHERPAATMMQDLSPEDLLQREPVVFEQREMEPPLSDRLALVTGAAGSIGSEMCSQLLQAGLKTLVMVDLNENGLYMLQRRLERDHADARVIIEVGDIRDETRMRSVFGFYRPQDVFHAAAHKHVPLMESAPSEAVKNNILGTRNVATAADTSGAERFVYISTDKAVHPTSVMGASKRVGEMIVRDIASRSRTRFCAVRFGNVLGSAGSVVPIFQEQITVGAPVSVTHPDVRRYFMTLSEAVALVLEAAYGDFGELCVLDMGEQIRIVDLARHMITMAGLVPDVDVRIEFTGLRPGEKLYEELLTEDEEKTRRVEHKIFVVDCPGDAVPMDAALNRLTEAATLELDARIVELLKDLVPSYSATRMAIGPTGSPARKRSKRDQIVPPIRSPRAQEIG